MKKILGSMLAIASALPAGVHAELLKNFKMDGSLEVSALSANNVLDLNSAKYDKISAVQTRLMLHADWDVLDDVHARVSLDKNDRTYGTGSQSLTAVQGDVFVDEAYVKIDKLFGGLDTTLGRQYYGEPGDLVIYYGPKYQMYGMPITALDGGRFDWNAERVGVTVLAAKPAGVALSAASDGGSQNLFGFDVHVKPADGLSGALSLYNFEAVNSGTNGAQVIGNYELYVADLKGKLTVGGAWVKAEFAQDFGQEREVANGAYSYTGNFTGRALKLDLGYKADVSHVGAVTGWAQGAAGSGGKDIGPSASRSFFSIAGDYRPGGIYGRFAQGASAALGGGTLFGPSSVDVNTASDNVIFGAGLKATPASLAKLTAGLSYWNYSMQDSNSLPFQAQGNKSIGSEYDLDLSWAHSENVSVSVGVGSFQPGGFYKSLQSSVHSATNPATLAYTDFSIKF